MILDIRIMIAVAICALTATILNRFGLKFTYGSMKLEIIQKMTACISCLLCAQDNICYSLPICCLIITAMAQGTRPSVRLVRIFVYPAPAKNVR